MGTESRTTEMLGVSEELLKASRRELVEVLASTKGVRSFFTFRGKKAIRRIGHAEGLNDAAGRIQALALDWTNADWNRAATDD